MDEQAILNSVGLVEIPAGMGETDVLRHIAATNAVTAQALTAFRESLGIVVETPELPDLPDAPGVPVNV